MNVLRLTYPGSFLDLFDHAQCEQAQRLVDLMEAAFTDAMAALSLFQADTARRRTSCAIPPTGEPPVCPSCGNHRIPDYLQRRLPFVHARVFLYALDTFRKALTVLAEIPSVPDVVGRERDAYRSALPSLTPLRNTTQHLEDRARCLGKDGKPLELKPVINEMFHFPSGGVLALDILNGNQYGATTSDGAYSEIEVAMPTLTTTHRCLQAVINALPWQGRSRQYP